MANFSDRLKELRIERRLTQEQLADKFFLNKSSISRYEREQQVPELELLQQIADFFTVTTDYLLGNSDIRNPYISVNIKSNGELQDIIPEEFTNADEARAYVNKHQIFGSGGFDADRLDDDEILEFANALLEQMKMVSYKYKK